MCIECATMCIKCATMCIECVAVCIENGCVQLDQIGMDKLALHPEVPQGGRLEGFAVKADWTPVSSKETPSSAPTTTTGASS